MRKLLWVSILVAVGCSANRHAGQPCAMGEDPWWTGCSTEPTAAQVQDRIKYASVTQTINPNGVAGCKSLGVVPGQNELEPGVVKAASMGANTVLLGAQTSAQEGPYYDYAHTGNQPIYYTRTYVAMEAYVCPTSSAAGGSGGSPSNSPR